jgi:hypothetical protein
MQSRGDAGLPDGLDAADARGTLDAGGADAHPDATQPAADAESADSARSLDAASEAGDARPSSAWSGPPLFIAVGYDGVKLVSGDGAHWSGAGAAAAPGSGANQDDQYNYRRISYGGGRFVVVGGGCLPPCSSCPARLEVLKSDLTWTVVYSPTDGNEHNWLGGVANNGSTLWVAVGGLGPVVTSADGDNWTYLTANEFKTAALRDVAYGVVNGQGVFVAVGDRVARAYTYDGTNWTVVDGGADGGDGFTSVAFGNGNFVAVGNGGRESFSRDGGKTWQDAGSFSTSIGGIAYGLGDFAIIDNSVSYSSSSGVWPWTAANVTNEPQSLVHFASFNGPLFLGLSWTNGIRTSPDGKTWTTQTVTTSANSALESIAFSGD